MLLSSELEAMVHKNIIIAHDNKFNRGVCEDRALYFKGARCREISKYPQDLTGKHLGQRTSERTLNVDVEAPLSPAP